MFRQASVRKAVFGDEQSAFLCLDTGMPQEALAPYAGKVQAVRGINFDLMKGEILRQFGEKPLENKDYPKIINERRRMNLITWKK